MHENAPRMNGGIGLALDGPTGRVEISDAQKLTVRDERSVPMAPDELAQLSNLLERFAAQHNLSRQAEVRISGQIRTHVGMGSSTAIRLGAIEALAVINDLQLSRDDLVAASGRGGTSGIGINSYFNGGLFFDLGRANDGQVFVPSSQRVPKRLPLTLPAISLPDWPMLLCIPREIPLKTQQQEVAFFKRTTPLPAPASFEASYIALFQIYAAALEADYPAFCQGISRMQQTDWKRAERAEYGARLHDVSQALLLAGADCTGMSSLGPLLVCLAHSAKLDAVFDAATAIGCDVYRTCPAGCGRKVTFVHA